MKLSITAEILWATGFLWNVALLSVLFFKRRYRAVPVFFTWIAYGIAYTVACYFAFRLGTRHSYALTYWIGVFGDLICQVLVVQEIARHVLFKRGQWVEGAKFKLIAIAALAPVLAAVMALLMHPAASSTLDVWFAKANTFITLLICILFSGVVAASQQLGLDWKDHTMREAYGLIMWTMASFLTDTLHAYWATLGHFSALEYTRSIVFQGVSIYWAIAFWLPEKAPVALSATTIEKLNQLRSRLD